MRGGGLLCGVPSCVDSTVVHAVVSSGNSDARSHIANVGQYDGNV